VPSTLLGFFSGGSLLVSGNVYSGVITPHSTIKLKNSADSSGNIYVGMLLGYASGGITMTSGGALASGGLADAMEVAPGSEYTLPRLVCSGNLNKVAVHAAAAVSGRCRVFWEVY
jgi:hypothetical protein